MKKMTLNRWKNKKNFILKKTKFTIAYTENRQIQLLPCSVMANNNCLIKVNQENSFSIVPACLQLSPASAFCNEQML